MFNFKSLFFSFIFCLSSLLLSACSRSSSSFYDSVESYPHNTSSFTEGLFFYNSNLYESTGLYGNSVLYKDIDLNSGFSQKEFHFNDDIFAEGSTVFKDQLYVLSYQNHKAFVFDPDSLDLVNELYYPYEGWGLTTDGEYLIASDGSSSLYFLDSSLHTLNQITVLSQGIPVSNLNELEYINGYIWANVWLENTIMVIDPVSGFVVKELNFDGLLPADDSSGDVNDVLNGIAFNGQKNMVYITGKRWPLIFSFNLDNFNIYSE